MLIKMVVRSGQSFQILWRVTCLLRELNTSPRNPASLSLDSRTVRTACIVASITEICPPHSWMHPEVSCKSGVTMLSIPFAIICLAVSPMPIRRTPGF